MINFLKTIISYILDNSENIEINETNTESYNIYTIKAPENQIGKLIGRNGKVINSIRNLAKAKANLSEKGNSKRVIIKIESLNTNQTD